jgi:succinoglycan biosynthesis transport protein ExoP
MDPRPFDGTTVQTSPPISVRAQSEAVVTGVLLSIARQWVLILLVVIISLILAGGLVVVLRNSYRAEAMIQLDFGKRDAGGPQEQGVSAVPLDATVVVQSEAVVMRSRMIARRVVQRLGLADEPHEGIRSAWTTLVIWLRQSLLPRPSQEDALYPITPAEEAERDLMSRLTVSTDNRTYIITISYAANSPVVAARVANAVANEYLQRRAEAKIDVDDRRIQWLDGQVVSSTRDLAQAEKDAAAFRTQAGLLDSAVGSGSGEQQLGDLTAKVNDATFARIGAENRLARVKSLSQAGSALATSDLQDLPTIRVLTERELSARNELIELQTRLGPQHPTVVQARTSLAKATEALAGEATRTVSGIEASVEMTRHVEQAVKERLANLERQIIATKTQQTTLRNLEDRAQAIRERLGSLRRNYEQLLADRAFGAVSASLVVPADPVRFPASPNPVTFLTAALLGGLGIGVLGAILIERRDRGFRSSDELSNNLGVRCLGMLPYLSGKTVTVGRRLSRKQMLERIMFDEAVRAVGAGVRLFNATPRSRVVLITSVVPGEGKSLFCRALADALVASGQRVLLIDGTPTRSQRSSEDPPSRGRDSADGETSLIAQYKAVATITADAFAGHFTRMLADARNHFDVIVIESPPVMLVADTLVFGRQADIRILVTQWAATTRASVGATFNRLYENSVGVDGLVLTRVDLGRHARLRFADQCAYYSGQRNFYGRLTRLGEVVRRAKIADAT